MFLHVRKSLPQDSMSFTTRYEVIPTSFTKSCFDANVQPMSLSMIFNLYSGHPSTSIPFKFTYVCRLLVTKILMIIFLVTYLVTFRGHLLVIKDTQTHRNMFIALLFLEVPVLGLFPWSL